MDKRSSKDVDNIQWELPLELPLPSFRACVESSSSTDTGVILRNQIDRYHKEESGDHIPWSPPQNSSTQHLNPLQRHTAPGRSHTDTIVENHKYPADMMEEVLGGPLRHLASAPALLMLSSGISGQRRPTLTPMEEQRHPGKPDAGCRQSTTPALPFSAETDMEKPPELIHTEAEAPITIDDDDTFVTGIPLTCLIVGLMFAVFLISVDRTIISTVRQTPIPRLLLN
jgi:hypothetical protein